MTCPEVVSYLDDLVDGVLPPDTASKVRDHIRECDSCRQEYELTRRVKDVLAGSATPDPGPEYFKEAESLILARATSGASAVDGTQRGRDDSVSNRRGALMRALLSLAASLAILFAAIYIGTSDDARQARLSERTAPMLATADVRRLVGDQGEQIFTQEDQARLVHGMMLLGSPGILGRFVVIPEFSRTIPTGKS